MLKHEHFKWQEIIRLGDSADNISFESRKSLIVKCSVPAETVTKSNSTENERLSWYSRQSFRLLNFFFFHLQNFMLLSQVAEFSFKPFHEQD